VILKIMEKLSFDETMGYNEVMDEYLNSHLKKS